VLNSIQAPAAQVPTPFPTARTALVATPRISLGRKLGWHGALWLVLALISSWVLTNHGMPIAVNKPLLTVAIAATTGVVALAIAHLGAVRFQVLGGRFDLFAGLAFTTLALTNLSVGVIRPIAEVNPLTPEKSMYTLLFGQGVATALFLLGLARAGQVIPRGARRHFAWQRALGLMAALIVGLAAMLLAGDRLPDLLDARTTDLLLDPAPMLEALPGQALLLLILNAALTLALLVAALGYVDLSRRIADPQLAWLAAALILFSFGQMHAFLFPPLPDWVGWSDSLKLVGYLVLLFSMVVRLSGEIAERASREERLRLSRELHDGLAQHLALLNLKLSRAAATNRSPEVRARNLEAAMRLVEAASLEARQAITALRTGRVAWDEFTRTLGAFADEFANNHDVEVRLTTRGHIARIEADLQAEVLRLLQETFSNAIRHGGARSLVVEVLAEGGALEISITDDGSGFDPHAALAGPGIGLKSIGERLERRAGTLRLLSAPGHGAIVRGRLPLVSQPPRMAA
jgi:signal transduction histidine kinase